MVGGGRERERVSTDDESLGVAQVSVGTQYL